MPVYVVNYNGLLPAIHTWHAYSLAHSLSTDAPIQACRVKSTLLQVSLDTGGVPSQSHQPMQCRTYLVATNAIHGQGVPVMMS